MASGKTLTRGLFLRMIIKGHTWGLKLCKMGAIVWGRGYIVKGKYTYRGVTYKTLKELAEGSGVKVNSMNSIMSRRGITYTEYLDEVLGRRVTYEGEVYSSMTAFAKVIGEKALALRKYMDAGYTLEESVSKCKERRERRKRVFRGKPYETYGAMVGEFGYTESQVRDYISNRQLKVGVSEALEQLLSGNCGGYEFHGVERAGKKYRSNRELIESYGIQYTTAYEAGRRNGVGVLEYLDGIDSGKYEKPVRRERKQG